jgi:hypothetical protein
MIIGAFSLNFCDVLVIFGLKDVFIVVVFGCSLRLQGEGYEHYSDYLSGFKAL